ncbi:MAG: FAD-dependent monooxygenase [Planctomycetota bacterium]
MAAERHVIIAGAGIGGLCAAIALRRRGFAVTVLEKQSEPREVGAGLSLWVNATRALASLGLSELIEELSVPAADGGLFDHRGQLLTAMSTRAFEQRFGGATVVVHRPDFLHGLCARCDASIRGAATVVEVQQTDSAVKAILANGEEVQGDCLIGADGIGSVVRAAIGRNSQRRYAGCTAYRGVVRLEDAGLSLSDSFWGIYLAPGVQAGCTPMAQGRVYWFIGVNAAEGGPQGPGGHRDAVLDLLSPWPDTMQRLAAATPDSDILRNDLYDLPCVDNWSEGRVTLLGDAAHATTPNLGQGACMAIEDAVVVARSLAEHDTHEAAFQAYEAARLRRCNRVTRSSRFLGRVLQLENPLLIKLRNFAMRRGSERSQMQRLAWLLEHQL